MKKAIINTGGKQYLVEEGQTLQVELLGSEKKVEINPLLVIDNEKVLIGKPVLDKNTVFAEVVENDFAAPKVTAIRYKAKKRVHKIHGHRQHKTVLKITKIS